MAGAYIIPLSYMAYITVQHVCCCAYGYPVYAGGFYALPSAPCPSLLLYAQNPVLPILRLWENRVVSEQVIHNSGDGTSGSASDGASGSVSDSAAGSPHASGEAQYLPHAVFFDMDGTLINSEVYWAQVERTLATENGVEWTPELMAGLQGTSLAHVADELIRLGVPMGREEVAHTLVDYMHDKESAQLPWIAGARDFLQQVHDAHIPAVLVTGSPRVLVRNLIDHVPDGIFAGYVCDESLPDDKKKPQPDPYYMAAEIAGIDPQDRQAMGECMVFEDSVSGLHAASAAGAVVVRIAGETSTPASERAPHSTSIPDFAGFTIADVSRIMIEARG